ncbi:hypothetical protein K435DRAFT_970630 [Dendrothele bispora CBS 962.96]|uniref:Rhodopsin domain-containing protein n=1 Tax=Dendrothele bispora (strain CBS 962.96) TaxID=1314807 RepID=A0A4S8LAT4_DENBC|nr:hypothetical protein K435DRAFT_970630 [Dendrothele bispora CBS 962.96]
MTPSGPSFNQIRAAAIAGVPIAICATSFRLFLRARKRSLWWDDGWAFMSMCAITIFLAGLLISISEPDRLPAAVKIAAYYMVAQGFYGVVWCSRVSMMFTLIRLSYGHFRTLLEYLMAGFIMAWIVLFSQVWWTCETQTQWKSRSRPACPLGTEVAIAQFITDGFCGLTLLACPFYLFSALTHWDGLKIRLVAIFSSTIFTLGFSLAHAYAILRLTKLTEFMLAVMEVIISLLVVNLPVITGWLHKLKDDCRSSEFSGPSAHINSFLKERLNAMPGTPDCEHTIVEPPSSGLTRIEITILTDRLSLSDDGLPTEGSSLKIGLDDLPKPPSP